MALYVGNTRYKVMVGNQKHDFVVPLPYDAEVEYLESTGTQYVDTGIKAAGNLHVRIFLVDYFTTEHLGSWPFGGRNGYLNKTFGIFINSNDEKLHQSYGNQEYVRDVYSAYPQSCWVEIQGGTLKVDTHTYTAPSQSFISDYNLFLFGMQNGDTAIKSKTKMGAALVSNGGVTLDIIPVRKGTTGYMYDRISGVLFGNAGTGSFVIGPDKNLPYDAEVEYLKSTGTQYIDTGIIPVTPTDTIYVKVKVNVLSDIGSPYRTGAICGVVDGYGSNDFAVRISWYAGYYGIDTNNRVIYHQSVAPTDVVTEWYLSAQTRWCKSSAKEVKNETTVTDSKTYSASSRLFCASGSGTGAGIIIPSQIYGYYHERNGVKLIDLIPVRKGTTGYLYDKVSRQLFGNAGTGNFILGNDVTT